MDRRVTPPKRVTSATLGRPPPCKQARSPYYVNPRQFIQLFTGKPVVSIQSRLDSGLFNSSGETAQKFL